jgi:Gpi18-like mannosyltransferase
VTSCQNLLSKTQFWIRFPYSIIANLHELHCLEVNIVISCILWSFKHPRVKYTIANWVATCLIKSFSFIKCLSMEIRMVLE